MTRRDHGETTVAAVEVLCVGAFAVTLATLGSDLNSDWPSRGVQLGMAAAVMLMLLARKKQLRAVALAGLLLLGVVGAGSLVRLLGMRASDGLHLHFVGAIALHVAAISVGIERVRT